MKTVERPNVALLLLFHCGSGAVHPHSKYHDTLNSITTESSILLTTIDPPPSQAVSASGSGKHPPVPGLRTAASLAACSPLRSLLTSIPVRQSATPSPNHPDCWTGAKIGGLAVNALAQLRSIQPPYSSQPIHLWRYGRIRNSSR